MSGQKNSLKASLWHEKTPLYKIVGQWTGESKVTTIGNSAQKDVPFWNAKQNNPQHVIVAPVENQTPWEARQVWRNVAGAIEKNDVETAGRHKSAIEIGQRKMREEEDSIGETWKQRFFTWVPNDQTANELRAKLSALTGNNLGGNVGSWICTPDEEDSKAIESGTLFGTA